MKKTMSITLILSTIFLLAAPSCAISLEECINRAIKSRDVIKKYEYQVKAAKEKERAAMSGFLPTFDLEYSASRARTRGSYGGTDYQNMSGFAGSSSYLPIGAIDFSGDLNETRSYSTFSATLAYNLFRGFGDYRALKAAQFSTSAQNYLLSAQIADVILDVKKAYIQALRAKSYLRVAKVAVKLLEKQKADTQTKREVGLVTKRQVLKVQVELDSARQNLLTAETNFIKAVDRLKRVVGIPYPTQVDLNDVSLREIDVTNFEKLKKRMLEQRSEIRYYRMLISSLEEQKKASESNYYPSIGVSLSYTKFGDDFDMKTKDEGMDYETLFMMTARWNLFNGLRDYAGVKETLYRKIATERELNELENQLVLQLRNSIDNLKVAKNRLKVAESAVKEGKEHYRITYESFKNGLATTTNLLDARYFLTRSEIQKVDAFYDVQIAIAELQRILEITSK